MHGCHKGDGLHSRRRRRRFWSKVLWTTKLRGCKSSVPHEAFQDAASSDSAGAFMLKGFLGVIFWSRPTTSSAPTTRLHSGACSSYIKTQGKLRNIIGCDRLAASTWPCSQSKMLTTAFCLGAQQELLHPPEHEVGTCWNSVSRDLEILQPSKLP